jgi:hypothetical protein
MKNESSHDARKWLRTVLCKRALAGFACLSAALLTAAAPEKSDSAIPQFMEGPQVSWTGYSRGEKPSYEHARTFAEWQPPLSGLGPITDDPAHPYYNNQVARETGLPSTYRVANLNNEAAKNLMPWALEALKKQNALALAGKNGEPRQMRCWEQGVPNIHEAPFNLYFIQTAKEVVMIQGGKIRRVHLNMPHSKNPAPSWWGESIGHYEGGDTLVVDTIALSDRTFVDGYRTPHTTDLHVVERFRIADRGKTLDVSMTMDDPKTFYKPFSARRSRYWVVGETAGEDDCASNNDDKFGIGLEPVPTADKPDF